MCDATQKTKCETSADAYFSEWEYSTRRSMCFCVLLCKWVNRTDSEKYATKYKFRPHTKPIITHSHTHTNALYSNKNAQFLAHSLCLSTKKKNNNAWKCEAEHYMLCAPLVSSRIFMNGGRAILDLFIC